MGKLEGRVVVVTGASRGIGAEIARLFAAEGGKIICAARTLHEGEHSLEGSLRDLPRKFTLSAFRSLVSPLRRWFLLPALFFTIWLAGRMTLKGNRLS